VVYILLAYLIVARLLEAENVNYLDL